jgi:hypothetical protein
MACLTSIICLLIQHELIALKQVAHGIAVGVQQRMHAYASLAIQHPWPEAATENMS